MARRPLSVQLIGGVLILASHLEAGAACESGNLLLNPGFEEGAGGLPAAWQPVALPGGSGEPTFTWSDDAASGERSAEIAVDGTGRGLWQQLVPVDAGRVYVLSGQVAFEGIVPPGTCHLEAVFRDAL